MAGNVWEWCATKWRASYREEPDDSPEGEASRVARGGSWYSDAQGVRGGCRNRDLPGNVWNVSRWGFRLAQ
jgi:formylglycine-generating enzyme required for sulfatase activity